MTTVEQIDSNFVVETKIDRPNLRFLPIDQPPFSVHGSYFDDGKYRRLPQSVAAATNEGVLFLHANTAGGRLRFKTDSPYVAISARMSKVDARDHFALTGTSGFDLYANTDGEDYYVKTFRPPVRMKTGYESVIDFEDHALREITIHFPLYSDVHELYIGLAEDAVLEAASPYLPGAPIVYYGSSITQGGCASRPGMAYQNILARYNRRDFINLGFSGSARAEQPIIDYINGLDMSLFVYDYDHNAPTVEYLRDTHEKMFCAIREKHPDLPILMMSRPKTILNAEEQERLAIVRQTYENAVAAGDTNVYLIEGPALMAMAGAEGTVDNTHPTDFGFASMASAIGPVIDEIFSK